MSNQAIPGGSDNSFFFKINKDMTLPLWTHCQDSRKFSYRIFLVCAYRRLAYILTNTKADPPRFDLTDPICGCYSAE
jgi:hypothetical protein